MVIEAEAVAGDPEAVMKRLWTYVGLPYIEAAFEWDAAEVPKGWEHVRGWHKDAVSSSGIRRDDRDPDEVFEAAAAEAGHLREYLAHHGVFYEKLREASGCAPVF